MDDTTIHKYVCKVEDLNKFLPIELKEELWSLFYEKHTDGKWHAKNSAWRMFHGKKMTPQKFFTRYGEDFSHPTVRLGVALDLIKLDDSSVSNDSEYHYGELETMSPQEIDRFILHRNFRINLVNLDYEYTNVKYKDGDVKKVITVDRWYQGARFSDTYLQFFQNIFINGFDENTYVPFTNGQDLTTQVSLIPYTHPDFSPLVSRSYYDTRYKDYLAKLKQFGIDNISSFALVDSRRGKTHTGEFLIKVIRRMNDLSYKNIVVRIDMNGQICRTSDGGLDISTYSSNRNEILCVWDGDFLHGKHNRNRPIIWKNPIQANIPMVTSTTSSHYSVFRQRIPDYELKYAKNYVQFKNRLDGMELYLKYLEKDIWMKEVQASECFVENTFIINNLLELLTKNSGKIEIVSKIYKLLNERDNVIERKCHLDGVVNGKLEMINKLISEYNEISSSPKKMGQKMELGQKIRSLKMELTKSLKVNIDQMVEYKNRLEMEIQELIENFNGKDDEIVSEEVLNKFKEDIIKLMDANTESIKQKIDDKISQFPDLFPPKNDDDQMEDIQTTILPIYIEHDIINIINKFNKGLNSIEFDIDTTEIDRLILESEKWRGYMFNLGYELNQMKKMKVMCEDATIKVRRLLKNFRDRIERTQNSVWDENYQLKDGLDLTSLNVAGINDIILLYDWYACNAPQLTYSDLGFDNNLQFNEFRLKCNDTSLNLRKNEYAKSIASKKLKAQMIMDDLQGRMELSGYLQYDDKYGKDGQVNEEKPWSLDDVGKKQVDKLKIFSKADKRVRQIAEERKQYEIDLDKMHDRTISYLIDSGLIENESDLEKYAVRNLSSKYDGDVLSEIEQMSKLKTNLDFAIREMNTQKDLLKSILGKMGDCQSEVDGLVAKNANIVKKCVKLKNRKQRNQLLMEKIENETRIMELNSIIKSINDKHFKDFSELEKMRDDVDKAQSKYDNRVNEFKMKIGLNQDTLDNLMVGIYNKFQDEILDEKRKQK